MNDGNREPAQKRTVINVAIAALAVAALAIALDAYVFRVDGLMTCVSDRHGMIVTERWNGDRAWDVDWSEVPTAQIQDALHSILATRKDTCASTKRPVVWDLGGAEVSG